MQGMWNGDQSIQPVLSQLRTSPGIKSGDRAARLVSPRCVRLVRSFHGLLRLSRRELCRMSEPEIGVLERQPEPEKDRNEEQLILVRERTSTAVFHGTHRRTRL